MNRSSKKSNKICFFPHLFVSLSPTKPVQAVGGQQWLMTVRAGRVEINIDGIQRSTMPFVGQTEGKGRFLNVTCLCKSNFATLNSYHSGNATKRSRGCIISRQFVAIIVFWWLASMPNYIILLGVGWLALLILDTGAMRRPDLQG